MNNLFYFLIPKCTTGILIILSLITVNSFAQFTTVDMFNTPANISFSENGYYYKDVTGYFDQFIGTWEYQNGNNP